MEPPAVAHLRRSLGHLGLAGWLPPMLMTMIVRASFATTTDGGLTLNGLARTGSVGVLLVTVLCGEWTLVARHLAARQGGGAIALPVWRLRSHRLMPVCALLLLVCTLLLSPAQLRVLVSCFVAVPAPAVALAVGGVAIAAALAATILLWGIRLEQAELATPDSFAPGLLNAVQRIVGHHRVGGPALFASLGALGAAAFAGAFLEPVLLFPSQERAGYYGTLADAAQTAMVAGLPTLLLSLQLFRAALAAGAAWSAAPQPTARRAR